MLNQSTQSFKIIPCFALCVCVCGWVCVLCFNFGVGGGLNSSLYTHMPFSNKQTNKQTKHRPINRWLVCSFVQTMSLAFAAAFGESWEQKKQRIRRESPQGKRPGWDLVG